MPFLFTDQDELRKLKQKKQVIESRIKLCKANLSSKNQITSHTMLELVREDARLAHLIAAYIPYDFTPNPGGSTPAPAAALFC
jgi:hypothetical protein